MNIVFQKLIKIFFGSMIGAQLCAILYAIMVQLKLDPNDLAYNQSILRSLFDPFVITISATCGLLSGLAVFPINCFLLWHRKLYAAGLFVLIMVAIEIIVVFLLIDTLEAWYFSYVTYLVALLIARYSKIQIFEQNAETL